MSPVFPSESTPVSAGAAASPPGVTRAGDTKVSAAAAQPVAAVRADGTKVSGVGAQASLAARAGGAKVSGASAQPAAHAGSARVSAAAAHPPGAGGARERNDQSSLAPVHGRPPVSDVAGPPPGRILRRRGIPPKLYRIGEVAEYSGVSRQTIHNYTTMGLIREVRWTNGGHRQYDETVFKRLDQIDLLKAARKSLEFIRKYFAGLDAEQDDSSRDEHR